MGAKLSLLDILFPLDDSGKLFIFERMSFFDRRTPSKRKSLAISEIEHLDRHIKETPPTQQNWAKRCTLVAMRVIYFNIQLNDGRLYKSLDEIVVNDLVEFFGATNDLSSPIWQDVFKAWREDRLISEVAPGLIDGAFAQKMAEKRREHELEERRRIEGAEKEKPLVDEIVRLRSLGETEYALARRASGQSDLTTFARHIFAFERIQSQIGNLKSGLKYADPGGHWVDNQRTG